MKRLGEEGGEGQFRARAARTPAVHLFAPAVREPHSVGTGGVLSLQRSAGNAAVSALMRASMRSERQERAEEASAQETARPPVTLLRSLLRSSPAAVPLVQRVTTSGGEWDTDKYDLLKDVDQGGRPLPPAAGVRGVDITLRFKPAATVDAELIGLTQSVLAFVSGAPSMTASQAAVAIPAAAAKPANTGPGETDEGAAIDRAAGFNNPIYAVKSTPSRSLADTNTAPGWGQHGFHFKDAAQAVHHGDALLKDTPMRSRAQKDSRHIFETTALATRGAQSGTYYGSVRWGWRTDSAGSLTKIPLEKVSDGVPSSTFMKAAEIWNPATDSTGAAHVDLPLVDVKIASAPITLSPPVPMVDIALPAGTRLQILRNFVAPLLSGTVKVVDGPHTGTTGEVSAADWAKIVDERS